jgi:hypothetical protein
MKYRSDFFRGRLMLKPLILEQNIPTIQSHIHPGALATRHRRSGTYTELSNMKMIKIRC